MVGDMIDGVISPEFTAVGQSQARILQALSVFARIDPRLFTTDQVQLLKAYVTNLSTTEDLAVFRPTVVIFRHVFPCLSTLQESFLEEIWRPLLQSIGSLATTAVGNTLYKDTLLDVAHCIWTISPLVRGDPPRTKSGAERLMAFVCSIVIQLATLPAQKKDVTEAEIKRSKAWTLMLGAFGKVCDFDQYVDMFRATLQGKVQQLLATKKATPERLKRLTDWPGKSATVLLLDLVLPFTKQTWETDDRMSKSSIIPRINSILKNMSRYPDCIPM
jgi:cohesin loading factor subunit SCC2